METPNVALASLVVTLEWVSSAKTGGATNVFYILYVVFDRGTELGIDVLKTVADHFVNLGDPLAAVSQAFDVKKIIVISALTDIQSIFS